MVRDKLLRSMLAASGSLVLLACGSAAVAQTTGNVPREVVTPPTPQPDQASTASIDSRDAIEARACPFDGSPLRMTLNKVDFARADGSALQPEIADALSGVTTPTGDQPVRVICDIRDAANAALRRGGWIASVQVPPQEITTGSLRLNVITARIVETRVRGSAGPYESLLRSRIAQLEALSPLNEKAAERILLQAGDIPGLDVQLALRPSATGQGDVIGELKIDYRRFQILGNFQNYNSTLLGRETGYVRGELYGLTGLGDVTYIGVSSTADFKEQRIAQIGHIMTIGDGTTLGARFSYAWSRPDLGPLDLRTDTLIAGLDLTHSLKRSLYENIQLGLGLDYINQISKVASGTTLLPLTTDKLRIAFATLSGDAHGVRMDGSTSWSLRGTLELRKGFDIFGSSDRGFTNGQIQSRFDGNSRAFVVRASGQGVVGIGKFVNLLGEVQAQWTDDALLNYEEFSLGNLTIGRGYDPGSNSGDRAIGLRGEAQFNVPLTAAISTQLFGFYDYVALDNLDAGSLERDRTFRSFGGGIRLAFPGKILLEIAYAHPLDKALTLDAAPPPDRVLVSLSFRFRDTAR